VKQVVLPSESGAIAGCISGGKQTLTLTLSHPMGEGTEKQTAAIQPASLQIQRLD
jgi:hypothetical protein